MSLPKFLQPYLASYDLSKLDLTKVSVQREIITQVLNLGDPKTVKWVFESFSPKSIKGVVENPDRGVWFDDSICYWQKILGVSVKKGRYKEALINFNQT